MIDEIYVSTDVEADGPIPGPHSMLSFASAAYTAQKSLVGTFSRNLETLPNAAPDARTAAWWKTHPEAWAVCRHDPQSPELAMREYVAWLKELPGRPVFVGYPAAYDFMFVYWYLKRFVGESPFSHSALDIETFAMVLLGTTYRDATKRNMPSGWFDASPHTHVALDDAIGQGALFCNMLAETRIKPSADP
ncbi:MAG TPA: hypothetical protein VEK07_08435 [Polyangiaceae bacterium]|nr:hypothetical protein [Polyangiaceae bacterium]